ncbi:tandem-type lipoprotein [Staphylococcus pettenkoferi]|uniref:Tandem-type lipoprotein n=1 Tax=Staphylococcus pettenkoferi TaxID=170573 RepID=A0ABT4BIB1_9STAP|nr:Csa1 family protein [Staphylococcus pettenkoferi]MCY1564452.1 tandem-type lipoprotein [Staphylococcus pettenkoferi]MCY1582411.1 tandem-type lipoprotein [Staphylococcus pettenkoferi]
MTIRKALQLIIILVLILTTATGCDLLLLGKDRKIKNLFNEKLSFYPVKNLDDYYHLTPKGEYEKINAYSGVWIVHTSYSIRKDEILFDEGAVLYIDLDNKTAKGNYYKRKIFDDKQKGLTTKETKYKIIMKNNQIKCIDSNVSPALKKKIENFKFMSQYSDFKNIKKNQWVIRNYNYTLNNFFATRNLSNEDEIVKDLREIYDIKDKSSPSIAMSGASSEFKKDNNLNISLDINFNQNDISISDAIKFDSGGVGGEDGYGINL